MRLKRTFLIALITLLFWSTSVLASGSQITVEGENICKPNETKTLKVKVYSSAEPIGVVSGKIEASENITIDSVTGTNGWTLTFDANTGIFNIYKAEGSKEQEIIDIKYKAANAEGTGKITLSELQATTTDYVTEDVKDISEEITIKNTTTEEKILTGIEITKEPTKTTYTEGEKFSTAGMVVSAKYSDGTSKEITNYTFDLNSELKQTDKKVVITYKEGTITKTAEQPITVKEETTGSGSSTGSGAGTTSSSSSSSVKKDNTVADKGYPKTGAERIIIPIILVTTIVGISYITNKKYKKI